MAGQALVKLHLPFEMLVGGESCEDKEEEEEIIEVQLKDVELLPSFVVAPAGADRKSVVWGKSVYKGGGRMN